jgi:hypothetical protein
VFSDTLGERNATDQYGGQVKLWNHEEYFLSLQESSGLFSAQVETPGTNCGHKVWTFKYFVLLRISAEGRKHGINMTNGKSLHYPSFSKFDTSVGWRAASPFAKRGAKETVVV